MGKAQSGYFLFGLPGTGKSSLIGAITNYLKFDVFDLELTNVHGNMDLKRRLLSVTNRSILVIEDIDCRLQIKDRRGSQRGDADSKVSTLLLFLCRADQEGAQGRQLHRA